MATAVEAAWDDRQKVIHGPLVTRLERVESKYQTPPTRPQLVAHLAAVSDNRVFRDYELIRTQTPSLLRELVRREKLRTAYGYPVQTLKCGEQSLIVTLVGEVVAQALVNRWAGRA